MKECRFCNGTDLKVWTGKYYRCNDCLYICTVPAPSTEEIDAHYANYHEQNHQASETKNKARAISYIQEIDWIKRQTNRPLKGPVFDYGASGGYFLDALVGHGGINTDVAFGDDLSPGARETLAQKGYRLPIESAEKGEMQLVVLRGVLEHVLDFRTLLKELTSLVADDGYFFITATPDSSSTLANVYREKWVQHHYPSHFQHFSSALVDQLFAELGFTLADHVDLYKDSVYRSDSDDSSWLAVIQHDKPGQKHAYWGSMMTRLYKRF